MSTNDEIINKMPTVIRGSISDIEKALYEARASTAKEIFAKFDKIIGYHTVSGEYSASGSIAHIHRSQYEFLKKQYKVD